MTSPGKTSINYDEWYAMKKEFDEAKPESTLAKERNFVFAGFRILFDIKSTASVPGMPAGHLVY